MRGLRRLQHMAVVASAVTAMIVLAACGGNIEDDSPMPTSAVAQPTVVSPEDRNNQSKGSENYVISVASVEDPAKAADTYKQKLGNSRLIAVQVNFENVKGTAAMEVNTSNLRLLDSAGRIYEQYVGAHADEVKAAKLKQGEKASGWVAFEIPQDAKPAKLRYTVGLLTTVQLEVDLPAK